MPQAGEVYSPSDLPRAIARNHRETTFPSSSTWTTGTESVVMALDGVTVRAGKMYRVTAAMLNIVPSVSGDIGLCRLRYNTAGLATASNSQLGGLFRVKQTETANTDTGCIVAYYFCEADSTSFSVALTLVRAVSGAGSSGVRLFGSANDPVDLVMELCGDNVSPAGRIG